MSRNVVSTSAAPAAIGPYSQAVRSGGFLFCSGQVGVDPATGQLVGGGDVAAETRQVLKNVGAVLAAAGTSFAGVVKATIFLADMADFATVNEIYGAAVGTPPPARSTFAVAGLPRGARVEIEVIAELA
jgi:2-iminobutanoate/2-iminopropanoate deaminase